MTRSAVDRFEKFPSGRKKGARAKSNRPAKAKSDPLALEKDLREIGKSVPAEEWAKLPKDFNENLDHYLYGVPKKKPTR